MESASLARRPLFLVFVFLVAVVAYLPALRAGFVWDDDAYVTENRALRSWDGLRRIWLEPGATTQYYPLVHTSFWIEYRLWKLRPFGFHLVNVLLHAASAALLASLLARLGVPGAPFAALLFALHPVHVESVAWITERKNVLSGLFYILAARSWFLHAPPGGAPGERSRRDFVLAFVFFVLALLAKTVTATLPIAILAVLWWKKGRIGWSDARPLVPFLAAGLLLASWTAHVEKTYLGAQGEAWDLSFIQRVLLAGRALVFYVSKLAWPAELTFIYPRWDLDPGSVAHLLYPIAVLGAFVALFAARRKIGRGPFAVFLFFAITLFPALGFVSVYPFRFSFVADHFQYLASIGPLALFAAGCDRAVRARGEAGRRVAPFLAWLLLFVFGALAWRQAGVYRDAETLWRDTIRKNDGAWMAHVNLGHLLSARGATDEAIVEYEAALRIRPDYDKAHNNLGLALAARGRKEEAIGHYREAIRANPQSTSARGNLGLALLETGRVDEAIACFAEALAIRPRAPELHTNLGVALMRAGRLEEAAKELREAVRLAPDDAGNHYRLGLLLVQLGKAEDAAGEFRETLRIDPNHAEARRALRARAAAYGMETEGR
jgi:tetratricopeptide (TPR) repeat protein